jgi:DNA anti-recombination protein RmuC
MSTLLASSLTACVAIVVALLVYFITRSGYSARAAAAVATATQLTVQLGERVTEMNTLRGQLATEQNLRARAEATLEEERKSIVEQKNTLNEAERKLTAVFEGLASKALANNTTTFLQLADATLKSGAVKDLQSLVKPIEDTLEIYQANLKAIEDARLTAYGEITTTLGQVSQFARNRFQ